MRGTTPAQDHQFHAVADRYDRATRRAVSKAVARGEPPLDPQVVPLARAYLARRTQLSSPPPRGFTKWWVAVGIADALAGLANLVSHHLLLGISITVTGVAQLATTPMMRRSEERAIQHLQRSRELLATVPDQSEAAPDAPPRT